MIMPTVTPLELEIRSKYLKAPSPQEIREFIEKIGVSKSQFERYYDIPSGMMKKCANGHQPLPVKYWPIFYEGKVPSYGLKYTKKIKKQEKKAVLKKVPAFNIDPKPVIKIKRLNELGKPHNLDIL